MKLYGLIFPYVSVRLSGSVSLVGCPFKSSFKEDSIDATRSVTYTLVASSFTAATGTGTVVVVCQRGWRRRNQPT